MACGLIHDRFGGRPRLASAALVAAFFCVAACASAVEPPRGIQALPPPQEANPRFDPAQSVGLFVGVRSFPKTPLHEVPFAVDDAIDLAYLFSIELKLIEPKRVRLLLAGEPQKESSRLRLGELLRAGASTFRAELSEILHRLALLSSEAGPEGTLIVTFATHGASDRGILYLLSTDSLADFVPDTAVNLNTVIDIVNRATPRRKIVLLDACSERIEKSQGASRSLRSEQGPDLSQELTAAMASAQGSVICSASQDGELAFDGDGNGVFTSAILEGLHCSGKPRDTEWIVAGDLFDYVNSSVTSWNRIHRPRVVKPGREGIACKYGGSAQKMVLAQCAVPPQLPPPLPLPACPRPTLQAVEIDIGIAGPRRVSPTAPLILTANEVAGLQNLTGRAVLSGSFETSPSCRCSWEEKDEHGWKTVGSGRSGCDFSISPPQSLQPSTLRLTFGGKPIVLLTVSIQ